MTHLHDAIATAAAVLFSAGAALAQAVPSAPAPARVITVDYRAVKGPRSQTYRECVGAGRVGEGLRADWQAQLKLCRDELGFEHLRSHGLLHDELGIYHEDAHGKPLYNFQYIDMVYDYMVSIGVRPFVEVGFTPNDLATIPTASAGADGMADDPAHPGHKRRVSVFWWKSNVTPPKDWAKWDALIAALVQHWTARYGADEVKQWPFEVWNEPNHVAFWSPNDNAQRMQEYFNLYAHTARAIKSINPAYHVGGPATAGPAYIDELIAYCTQNTVPLDFISFHAYGVAGGPGGFDEFGNKMLYVNPSPHGVANTARSQNATIAKSSKPGLPVHITEWSASYSDRDPVHDAYFSAPYILEQLKNTEDLASMSYWTFTDIFEENGVPPRPFHGGFGLLNTQGIKKPAYFAYRFLNLLGNEELVNTDTHSWVCRDSQGGVQALLWDLTMKPTPQASNQVYFREVQPPQAQTMVHFAIHSLKPGRYKLSLYKVGYEKNDAYTAYLKMGAPTQIDRAQVSQLKAIASGKPDTEQEIRIPKSGQWATDFVLRSNDVVLATLAPIAGK